MIDSSYFILVVELVTCPVVLFFSLSLAVYGIEQEEG
jgi:hypothetical protein